MSADEGSKAPAGDIDAAALMQHRDRIRAAIQLLPRELVRQILQAMDNLREPRRNIAERFAKTSEMGLVEMRREIAWRLETLPPQDAATIAALVARLAPANGEGAL